ncbi:MAG: flavodoxin-dependent (E)-4-hydroxy-3-methylbut-2-enyl-diphosphate synthase, partial [Clostridia bacterium]|nr:flavodoxin-dependent (E)-4-hydroxy-3-methylbut-2-enyl-diphosphate synthase [Clostridia bacterium]
MVPNQQTKQVFVGGTPVGGGAPVTVQSMLSVRADDREGNITQALRLQQAGCDILRISVPDAEAVKTLAAVKEHCSLPLVADIHFDYRLALESVAAGADKIRINPGNIGDDQKVKAVADACRTHHIPIRVGVNAGSLEKELLETYGAPTPEAMVESGRRHIALLEKFDFTDIVLSLKSSDVQKTVRAYELAAQSLPYPLHLGVTEAGTVHMGTLRSAAGIGGLLLRGIGDTFRVSLTDDPEREVEAGRDLLRAIGLRTDKIRFVSCPTCGRTKI